MQRVALGKYHWREEDGEDNHLVELGLHQRESTISKYKSGAAKDKVSPTAMPISIATAVRWMGKFLSSKKEERRVYVPKYRSVTKK